MDAMITAEHQQMFTLAELSRMISRHPVAFGRKAHVAIGTGPTECPQWLLIDLNVTGSASVESAHELPPNIDAALFLSIDGQENLLAGNRSLLEQAVRHYTGSVGLLALRSHIGNSR